MPTVPYYNAAGDRLPGVTTVIGGNLGWSKDGLVRWAYNLGKAGKDLNAARQGAADIGTIAHALVEAFICEQREEFEKIKREAPANFRGPALEAFSAFDRWNRQSRGLIVATELWLVDEEFQTGGCLDAIRLEDDLTLTLADWKSSNGTYGDHFIQICAYTVLLERKLTEWARQNGHGAAAIKLAGAHLCRFGKESGNFVHHFWPRASMDIGWSAFTWLRALHQVKRPIESLVR